MKQSVLVAGIGNIFLQDDGFGVEVAHRLGAQPLPEVVRVADFGIRGIHLAYELLEQQYDLTVLVDAIARGDKPGHSTSLNLLSRISTRSERSRRMRMR